MRKILLATAAFGAMIVPALQSAPASAGAPGKVWVSNAGTDTATCGATATPCKTLLTAVANVAAGGDIGVLTPGDYGLAVIGKAVNITNDGMGEALVQPLGALQFGVHINAGAGDVVTLRGLVMDGQVSGVNGIAVVQASAVHVQNCVIRNFEAINAFGIEHEGGQLFVSDTMILNNGSNATSGGIHVYTFGKNASVVLDRIHMENNVRGLWVDGTGGAGPGAHVLIRDSVVSGNASDGILASTTPGLSPAFIVVEHTTSVSNAGTGIRTDGPGATILLNDDTVTRNSVGIGAANGGQLISYGNNKVNNNIGPDGAPTGSYSPI